MGSTGGYDWNNRTIRSSPGGFLSHGVEVPGSSCLARQDDVGYGCGRGALTELVPNERVVYSVEFASDDPDYDRAMTMRWEVTDTAGGTLVEITAANVPDAVSERDHAAGLKSSLEKLFEYVVQ